MAKYDAYLIDLDGTIYHGKNRIPEAKRFIDRLKQSKTPYLFVTNNSTKTAEAFANDLTTIHDIQTTPEQVYTSAMATADYVAADPSVESTPKKVYLIGEAGLKEAFNRQEFALVPANEANYVVMGLDRDFNYQKLMDATFAIHAGAKFIATNADTNLPSEKGLLPGAGSLVVAIETASGKKATIIAKPEAPIMEGALKRLKNPKNPIMVGDNYQTDILAGIKNGLSTLLVYTGVSKQEQVAKQAIQPTHEIENFDEWLIEE
ncbi:TIGR01457 family HAD-type hydrolase [Fructobacillus sp. M1-13]|uniref:Acid sugar phosphatase n=1 Tax=Fructobacillus papyriferae TaxID=2713171 RepID=A0ABS5QQG6_9LACO|nr:TIGR01457 family HAD-type hydrolase [Fructobacillus papyriferae]MBS9335440.1 TIGR01457 family HAD-type hydrolase [Fructobacillus papyriferae]MCD2159210.1 TIGR01457 family HAD-type hydrolase [Fructobacillus papyriferae]